MPAPAISSSVLGSRTPQVRSLSPRPTKSARVLSKAERPVIEQTIAACASAPLEDFARELLDGLVKAHAHVAELHESVSAAVPASAAGFKNALHRTFERALSRTDQERYSPDDVERMLFVLPRMVESLVHGAAHQAPPALSRDGARSEAIRSVLLYVKSFSGSATRQF